MERVREFLRKGGSPAPSERLLAFLDLLSWSERHAGYAGVSRSLSRQAYGDLSQRRLAFTGGKTGARPPFVQMRKELVTSESRWMGFKVLPRCAVLRLL